MVTADSFDKVFAKGLFALPQFAIIALICNTCPNLQ